MERAIRFTPSEISAYYTSRVPHLKRRQKEWRGACPIHNGADDNFRVDPQSGRWHCYSQCGRGGDILDLEGELHGGTFKSRKAETFRIMGRVAVSAGGSHEVASYPYHDAQNRLLYEIVRLENGIGEKTFRPRRYDDRGGRQYNLRGVNRVPYRLPQVLSAETVYLVEGEKDVHTLESWGVVASCNPGGTGGSDLYSQWAPYFQGRHVVILPDNDDPGRKHAATVASLLFNVAQSIRVVELPGLQSKGDVTDWKRAGGTYEQLHVLASDAPVMDAEALRKLATRWRHSDQHELTSKDGGVVTCCVADIITKPVTWLWPERIALGKLSIIAGNPGLGKSQITASIAANVTVGGHWPLSDAQGTAGSVVLLSAEDDAADTLRPRLEAAGANLNRVHILTGVGGKGERNHSVDRSFNLQLDLQRLSDRLTELGDVSLLVVDPISAYLGDLDSHRNSDVRALLALLSRLAAQHNIAIIGVSHLNKSVGHDAMMRVTGSLAFVAAARAAYLVARDPENAERRLFLPMKNNLGPDDSGLAFRIESLTIEAASGPVQTSRIVWDSSPVVISAEDAIGQPPERASALREAKEWLEEMLMEPRLTRTIIEAAREAEISEKTLRRAAKALGVLKQKNGMEGGWMWSLAANMAKASEDTHHGGLGTFGSDGHLLVGEGGNRG